MLLITNISPKLLEIKLLNLIAIKIRNKILLLSEIYKLIYFLEILIYKKS